MPYPAFRNYPVKKLQNSEILHFGPAVGAQGMKQAKVEKGTGYSTSKDDKLFCLVEMRLDQDTRY
jgi:hypothetical protein